MNEPQKQKTLYPLPNQTLMNRRNGYSPPVEALDRECKDRFGTDAFYDKESDCCARYEQPQSAKQAETGRYWFITW